MSTVCYHNLRLTPTPLASSVSPCPSRISANPSTSCPSPPRSLQVRCQAQRSPIQPYYQDNAYFSDDDVTPVDAVLYRDEKASDWLDANYVSLSVTCFGLMRQHSQDALKKHFTGQRHDTTPRNSATNSALGNAVYLHSTVQHHACCAPTRDHTFCCGEDAAVAAAVAPASVKSGDHFVGTP